MGIRMTGVLIVSLLGGLNAQAAVEVQAPAVIQPAAVVHGRVLAEGLLSVQHHSGGLNGISPVMAVKAELIGGAAGVEFVLTSGSSLMRFTLDGPQIFANEVKVYAGVSDTGLKMKLRDSTACSFESCQGPSWKVEISRLESGEPQSELTLAGDATLIPEPISPVPSMIPADIGSYAP